MPHSVEVTDSNQDIVWPVVVVGPGPAGLVAALTLAGAGIHVLVLNSRKGVFSHPRATVVSLRSTELFRVWGLRGEISSGPGMSLEPTAREV